MEYWFWYYFNDWNNTHESDWEMIQLIFNTTSVEEALTRSRSGSATPSTVAASSPTGVTTRSRWTETDLLVYPSAGSHATYFRRGHLHRLG